MAMEKAAESRFWDRYIEVLKQAEVPELAHRWYVVRIERYIAAHSKLRLRLHTPSTLERISQRRVVTLHCRDGVSNNWCMHCS
jgi:hypothetical protein